MIRMQVIIIDTETGCTIESFFVKSKAGIRTTSALATEIKDTLTSDPELEVDDE